MTSRTPLTIITGYLGTGKTTLLRHIMANARMKIAIVMNEFGEIGIDQKIIKGKNVDITELSGGCVCCSLTGELEQAIKEIIEKTKPEWIVLETTGTAEPDAILINLKDFPYIRLDAVITIADADAMIRFPDLGKIGIVQIDMADIILVNKTDLVSRNQIKEIEDRIKKINPRAVLHQTEKCKIQMNLIFGIMGSEKKGIKHKEHQEKPVEQFSYISQKTFDMKKFEQFAKTLPKEIYRAKGFVRFEDGLCLFNYVAGRFDFEEFAADRTELVFIGTNINKYRNTIIKELEKCFS